MAKATFRLPDYLMDELRERSRAEDRSLNAVAVDVLRRGLGHPETSDLRGEILSGLLAKPATSSYDPASIARHLSGIPTQGCDLEEALQWTRQDRF